MKFRAGLTFIICGAMVFAAQAAPISYTQINNSQDLKQTSATNPPPANPSEPTDTKITVESLDQPEFVRLADGRMIPYGPGVICSDACVEPDVISPHGFSRKWLIAIPLVAGVAVIGALLGGDHSTPVIVSLVNQPPTVPIETTPGGNPTPTPTPGNPGQQPQPVPEPGTITLLGAGLALLSRKKMTEFVKRYKK